MTLSKLEPSSAGWSPGFTSLWVKLWGATAPATLFKRCHGRFTTCPQADTRTHARLIRANWVSIHCVPKSGLLNETRQRGWWASCKLCLVCTDTYTYLCYCLQQNWLPYTHSYSQPLVVARCQQPMPARCDLEKIQALFGCRQLQLAMDSSSIRAPLQWAAAYEINWLSGVLVHFIWAHRPS